MKEKRIQKTIDKPSIWYSLLRKYICFALTKVFYKRFTVTTDQPIPKDVPVVFAGNHQNALIDALVIICSTPLQPVFLQELIFLKRNGYGQFSPF
jgi:1-acyl-sn-glycerol-3-phosphate acyltransferase